MEDTCLPHQVAMMKELTQADRPVHVVVSEVTSLARFEANLLFDVLTAPA